MRYPFILLDVGQTLIGPRRSYGAIYAGVLAGIGLRLDQQQLQRGIAGAAEQLRRQIPTGADRFSFFPGGEDEFWLRFVRASLRGAGGSEVDDGLARRALEPLREAFKPADTWKVFDDVVPALEALRAGGCRLGIVSNWDSRLPALLERLGLGDYFDAIGVSALQRVEKPDPRLFRHVLDRLGARPEQALHVGDVPELDGAGARSAGVDAVMIDRDDSFDRSQRAVSDLSDLPRLARQGLDLIRPA